MKTNKETKRLFVGGLGQAISQADLQNQFSRFGEVSDVEIITRKDDQGNPQKIFAYVNIRLSEADLKKCMSVLNKTKWKGGTLQIQLAKESFLHRLSQEREEAKVKTQKSTTGNPFLKKTGVLDLHVKAVPGTEVPGHKNWVVSKFGRILPVLHLKNQLKRKIVKYDPSKYCHNLKKIGEDFTNTTPITNLIWELEGGNDPMSKKRRGEFSDFHCPSKKIMQVQCEEGSSGSLAISPRHSWVMHSPHLKQQQVAQKTSCDLIIPKSHPDYSDSRQPGNVFFPISGLNPARNRNSMSDDSIDSEDELRATITREETLQRTMWSSVKESEKDPFEVVRDDFRSGVHKVHSLTSLDIKNNVSCHMSGDNVTENDCGYDSGDTDEIIAMKKNVGKVKSSTEFSQMGKSILEKTSLKNRKNCDFSDHSVKIQKTNNVELAVRDGVKSFNGKTPSDSSSSEDANSVSELTESEGDEHYNTMMKNCLHVNLTLADLEQLACGELEVPKENSENGSQETTTHRQSGRTSKSPKTPNHLHKGKQCIHPEEIVASLLEEKTNISNKQKPKESNLKPKFQAFKGIGSLYEKESVNKSLKKGVACNNIHNDQNPLKLEGPSSISMEKESSCANSSSRELTQCQQAKKANGSTLIQPQKRQSALASQDHKVVSPSSSEKASRSPISTLLPLKGKKSLGLCTKSHKTDFDKDGHHNTIKTEEGSEDEGTDRGSLRSPEKSPKVSSKKNRRGGMFSTNTQEGKTDFLLCISNSSDDTAKDKHAQDNEKRLAALEARQKAKEIQKKLVHDALANLDSHSKNKPTHIVFGSDNESETEETFNQGKDHPEDLVKGSVCHTSGKLFDSDDENSASEDDSKRFTIKPQFEGKAGQKLMDLQSHFGADERFRMDSRFLESDSEEEQEQKCLIVQRHDVNAEVNEKKTVEEEELAAEKKKALDVARSVLHINLSSSTSKGSITAKKFKDIIRYDPTRHDHATFERKKDDKPKESKAKRKKKREEAEKLPDVSKEMYYNIAMDLKGIFQTTKDSNEKKENLSWNEDSSADKTEEINDPVAVDGNKESVGFTFSFFDSDAEDIKEETYRVQTVKPAKIAWKGDPRFQESSSEEEDITEEIDDPKPSPEEASLLDKETTRFFFFSKNDERLHVGSDLFWRGAGSNFSRNSWEARTENLRMDCRKKHKDAKRKVKSKYKCQH
ncbi:nucleolar protein 8 isoform X2 [Tamandua tetradactyla]|uniref:nucleolar protein 8 isoform X2 n=1 Tax=Tamandua tetradactyla TaxID=48850 RepID=UPI004053A165